MTQKQILQALQAFACRLDPPQRVPSFLLDTRPRNSFPSSTFVGRRQELASVRMLLRQKRLVSVVGPPGIGKSRLAVELVRSYSEDLDLLGSWIFDLLDLKDLADIVAAVHHQLGIRSVHGDADPMLELVWAIAAAGPVVICLDNADNLVPLVAALVSECRQAAPKARILVTSRERLGIHEEVLFELGPLSLPGGEVTFDSAEAVELFLDRARLVCHDYEVPAGQRRSVVDLLHELDGNPLAIELAAARLRLLTPAQMRAQMARRLDLLGSALKRAPRHITLRGALESSWNLLEPWEQAALAQCSVFAGPFSLGAAEQVVRLEGFSNAPPLVDVIAALRDKSLLCARAPAGCGEELRLSLYHLIREYAWERLGRMEGGREGAALRHASYYLELYRTLTEALNGAEADAARARLLLESENLAAARRRGFEGQSSSAQDAQRQAGGDSPREAASRPEDALLVDAQGSWFRAPGQPCAELAGKRVLCLLLLCLARHREAAPGKELLLEELVAAAWPGERILPKAAAARIYTALSTLRRLGLRRILLRGQAGYLLDPKVPLVLREGAQNA